MIHKAFGKIDLTDIKPEGWIYDQLTIQMNGLSGILYEIWDSVGSYSGWLGGTGESWERAPYYLDGLLPLAYYLNSEKHLELCKRFITWTLASQDADGNFGPISTKNDQWSRFAMLKVLVQYYEISGEKRVLEFVRKYLGYYTRLIKTTEVTGWSQARVPELLYCLKWLYGKTEDDELLRLASEIDCTSYDWNEYLDNFPFPRPTAYYINWKHIETTNPISVDSIFPYHASHIVNVTMGIKHPALSYCFTGDEQYRSVARKGIEELIRYHGVASGCINGDEHLAGNNPVQGSELCSVVEYLFSLQSLMEVFGEAYYGDLAERLAYNALPATISENFMAHQYLQQANQIVCNTSDHPWFNNTNEANTFGLEPHFGCCTANMHQGWPKLINSLWFKQGEDCLVNMVFAPSTVSTTLNGQKISIRLQTQYPFEDTLRYQIVQAAQSCVTIKIRIPAWCENPVCSCDGAEILIDRDGGFISVRKVFAAGDTISVTLPMEIRFSKWYKDSLAIERGPLVYGLDILEEWRVTKEVAGVKDFEVFPQSPWNYAVSPKSQAIVQTSEISSVPFSKADAPVSITLKARPVTDWTAQGGDTGELPQSPVSNMGPEEDIRLIPFGCTKLRISQFPSY